MMPSFRKWGSNGSPSKMKADEFSFDVVLPEGVTQMMWHGWDHAGVATDETRAFEAEIDRLLGEVIEREWRA